MASETREEVCDDCGRTYDRVWVVRTVYRAAVVPPGWRVARRRGEYKVIEARTSDRYLCLCDAS